MASILVVEAHVRRTSCSLLPEPEGHGGEPPRSVGDERNSRPSTRQRQGQGRYHSDGLLAVDGHEDPPWLRASQSLREWEDDLPLRTSFRLRVFQGSDSERDARPSLPQSFVCKPGTPGPRLTAGEHPPQSYCRCCHQLPKIAVQERASSCSEARHAAPALPDLHEGILGVVEPETPRRTRTQTCYPRGLVSEQSFRGWPSRVHANLWSEQSDNRNALSPTSRVSPGQRAQVVCITPYAPVTRHVQRERQAGYQTKQDQGLIAVGLPCQRGGCPREWARCVR
jgi:hypothetical protein